MHMRRIVTRQSSSSIRWLSSVSSLPPSTASFSAAAAATATAGTANSPPSKASSSNIILDHLGTIFLSAIGLIVASLVRSSYGTSNKNKIRDRIETQSALDPVEMEQLRQANAHHITPNVFRQIHQQVVMMMVSQDTHDKTLSSTRDTEHDSDDKEDDELSCTYLEFANAVKRAMVELPPETVVAANGDEHSKTMLPTIEMGHLLDRVVVAALEQELKRQSATHPNMTQLDTNVRRPVTFWFTALSLTMESDVSERIQILYEVLSYKPSRPQAHGDEPFSQQDDNINSHNTNILPSASHQDNDVATEPRQVSLAQVCNMVGYLQETCQLAPDTQVVATPDRQYPIQQYHRGNPYELTPVVQDPIDLPAFAEILRSRSVCAWGECYHKAKQSI